MVKSAELLSGADVTSVFVEATDGLAKIYGGELEFVTGPVSAGTCLVLPEDIEVGEPLKLEDPQGNYRKRVFLATNQDVSGIVKVDAEGAWFVFFDGTNACVKVPFRRD